MMVNKYVPTKCPYRSDEKRYHWWYYDHRLRKQLGITKVRRKTRR